MADEKMYQVLYREWRDMSAKKARCMWSLQKELSTKKQGGVRTTLPELHRDVLTGAGPTGGRLAVRRHSAVDELLE